MRVLVGTTIAAVVVCSVASGARQYPSAPPQTPGTGVIAGRVVEAGTNTGIPGVTVTLYGPPMPGVPGAYIGSPPGGARRVVTNGQGQFIYRDLPVASYSMEARATGYMNANYGDTRVIQVRRSLDVTRTIDITSTDRIVNATIQMWRKGGLGGRVLDEAGEPMAGMPVTILARVTDWGGAVTRQEAVVMTDDRGVYHKDVTPGQYLVGVLGATTTWTSAAHAGFVQAQAEGGDAFTRYMNDLTAQGGLLPRGIGARVGAFMVNQMATNNTQYLPPVTDEPGGPRFYPTMFHPASLTMSAATAITVGAGEEKTAIDVQLRPIPARRVSGRLLGPGGPVAGLAVRLAAQDVAVTRTSPATLIDTPQSMSDGNGDFTFVGIAPGAYHLLAIRSPQAASTANATPMLWATETVTVGDTDLDGLQIQLQTGAVVSGSVTVEGNGAPTPPDLRAVTIAARPVPGSAASFQTQPATHRPDASGKFATRPLIPGPYMITVTNVPPGWILKSVTQNGQNVVDKQFTLGAAGVADVVITISNQIGTVTGVVRDGDGKPAPAATVGVFPADKSLWRLPGMGSRRVQVALPARDGRYAFRGLPAGEYIVVAVDWPDVDFSDGAHLTSLLTAGQRITIGDGESRTVDLRMVTR